MFRVVDQPGVAEARRRDGHHPAERELRVSRHAQPGQRTQAVADDDRARAPAGYQFVDEVVELGQHGTRADVVGSAVTGQVDRGGPLTTTGQLTQHWTPGVRGIGKAVQHKYFWSVTLDGQAKAAKPTRADSALGDDRATPDDGT